MHALTAFAFSAAMRSASAALVAWATGVPSDELVGRAGALTELRGLIRDVGLPSGLAELGYGAADVDGLVEGAAEVGGFRVQEPQSAPLVVAAQLGCGAFGEREVVVAVPSTYGSGLARLLQAGRAVVRDGFQEPVAQPVAGVGRDDQ